MTRRLAGGVSVVVTGGGTGVAYDLPHLVRHSPDGFEWGYQGSGPADLARSIAGDVLDDSDPLPAVYLPVKRELVANIPREGGQITEDEVFLIVARLVQAHRVPS